MLKFIDIGTGPRSDAGGLKSPNTLMNLDVSEEDVKPWYVNLHSNGRSSLYAVLFAAAIALPACKKGGGGGSNPPSPQPQPPKPTCSKPYSKTALPVEIKKNGDIYFSIEDFAILENKNYQIDSMVLEGTLANKKHKRREIDEFSYSLNGTKLTRKDGGRHVDCDDDDDRLSSKSKFRFHSAIHKFFLHGGQPLSFALLKIKKQKGRVKISLHGPRVEILEARLVFTGWDLRDCHNPPPPPPPEPVQPNVQIDGAVPAEAVTASTSLSIAFSADQAGVTFNCSLNGAAAEACSSPASYSGLANGAQSFSVTATNAAGLTSAPASYTWTVDAEAPQVTIDNLSSLPALTSASSVSFDFSSNEAGTFNCSLDGAAAEPCASPLEYAGLAEGAHQFLVFAVDDVGNQSEQPASFQWVVDRTPPVASIVSVDPAQTVTNANSLDVQFAASESATFECSLDHQAFQACSSPMTVGALTEGQHWLDVRATDLAGNTGLAVSYSWSVDLTAPEISLVNVVPAPGLTNSSNISVDFTVSEISDVLCQFDGGTAQPCVSPFTAEIDSEGGHTLSIVARDAAGNSSDAVVLNWEADFSSPVIGFGEIQPSAAAFINSDSLSVEVVANENVTFSARLNGADLDVADSPIVLEGLIDGSYELSVTAIDRVGNAGNTISHSFTVDLIAPVAQISSEVGALTNLDANTLTFSASEDAQFSCNIDSAGFAACASPLNLSGLADGLHIVELRASDAAGNASDTVSAQWTVDTVAPQTSTVVTASDADPSSFSIQLISSEPNSTFLCSLDGAAEQPCVSPVELSGLQPGTHSLIVRATDAAGNTDPNGATALMEVVLPVDTTLVSSTPAAALVNQRTISFVFESNHADATFLCSLDGLDSTPCSSPQSYSDLTDGDHTFSVQAVDRFGNADETPASHMWTVDATAPVTTLSADQTARNAITFSFSADEPGSQFTCSMDGAAFTACTSPKSYSGLATGNHNFMVKATDNAGNTENPGASYSFTVLAPVTTTLNSVTPSATLTTQTSKTFTFSSNHANATFVCSLDGAAFTACSSPKSYSGLANGAHSFRVRAVDQWGGVDTTGKTHNWTIDNVAPTVSNVSTSVTSTTITVTWTTNEPATTKLNWGAGSTMGNTTTEDTSLTTSHSVTLTGLARNTLYTVQPAGRDGAGNQYTGTAVLVRTAR